MNFKDTEACVIEWANKKNINYPENAKINLKFYEEAGEVAGALLKTIQKI